MMLRFTWCSDLVLYLRAWCCGLLGVVILCFILCWSWVLLLGSDKPFEESNCFFVFSMRIQYSNFLVHDIRFQDVGIWQPKSAQTQLVCLCFPYYSFRHPYVLSSVFLAVHPSAHLSIHALVYPSVCLSEVTLKLRQISWCQVTLFYDLYAN